MFIYDVVSIFVNNMEWWSRHSIFKQGDTSVEIVRMFIVLGFDVKRYPNSTRTLNSDRWRLPRGDWLKSKEVHMDMSEVLNMSWSE